MVPRRGLKGARNLFIENYYLVGDEKLPAFLPLDVLADMDWLIAGVACVARNCRSHPVAVGHDRHVRGC
jgi:hypothetical protein